MTEYDSVQCLRDKGYDLPEGLEAVMASLPSADSSLYGLLLSGNKGIRSIQGFIWYNGIDIWFNGQPISYNY